ncbi:Uncharacterised protein [Mycobacteroides abscessus subsp. massiliense]|uniref:hypothetical protein n=1 Tax=Mycobacteroides abscessus TaxID=36809 RepID=UPI0009A5D034|nr:hypothetical protein [Mycobacteroides abscessus]SLI88040.1 Uncharacterised protein [Mycobacteroides abscessus subsp. massiliense]
MSADEVTPNVMQLSRILDKTSAVMDAFARVAESAGVDLRPDSDGIERALTDFFTDRDARSSASAVLKESV